MTPADCLSRLVHLGTGPAIPLADCFGRLVHLGTGPAIHFLTYPADCLTHLRASPSSTDLGPILRVAKQAGLCGFHRRRSSIRLRFSLHWYVWEAGMHPLLFVLLAVSGAFFQLRFYPRQLRIHDELFLLVLPWICPRRRMVPLAVSGAYLKLRFYP